MSHLNNTVKVVGDVLAFIFAAVSFLTSILPALAALASLIWTGIRIWEWYKEKKNGNQQQH